MKEMSAAKRKRYSGAIKLKVIAFAENLVNKSCKGVWNKWEEKIARDKLVLQSNGFCPALQYGSLFRSGQAYPAEQCLLPCLAVWVSPPLGTSLSCRAMPFALPCSMGLSSAQDRLGLAFFSCRTRSDGCFILCATLSTTSILQKFLFF